jgi:hypothetical protein
MGEPVMRAGGGGGGRGKGAATLLTHFKLGMGRDAGALLAVGGLCARSAQH